MMKMNKVKMNASHSVPNLATNSVRHNGRIIYRGQLSDNPFAALHLPSLRLAASFLEQGKSRSSADAQHST